MAQPYPSYPYAMPAYAQPSTYVQPQAQQVAQQARPAPPRTLAPAQQAAAPRPTRPAAPPVVRGQSPDEPRPARRALEMPTPEALGVSMPAKELDWTDVRVRLDRLGAKQFSLDTLPTGGFRFSFQLTNGRIIEAQGATESDAVQRAFAAAAK